MVQAFPSYLSSLAYNDSVAAIDITYLCGRYSRLATVFGFR
jgi:hypothetical protein